MFRQTCHSMMYTYHGVAAESSGVMCRLPANTKPCFVFASQVDQFLSKSGKFSVPGYPQKLGFLLYGPPGTGAITAIIEQHCSGEAVVKRPFWGPEQLLHKPLPASACSSCF